MNENSECQLCPLHENANERSVCLKGEGGDAAKLLILMDGPTIVEDRRHKGFVSDGADFVRWCMSRMSVKPEEYYLDYVIKCHAGKFKPFSKKAARYDIIESCSQYRLATLQHLRPKSVVGMGRICCEAFVGSDKIGDYEGAKWTPKEPFVRDFVSDVWLTYAPAYVLQDPSASVTIYRVLQEAATEAGLQVSLNPKINPFAYGT